MDTTTIVLVAFGVILAGVVYYVYSTMRYSLDELTIKVSRLESTIKIPSRGVELETMFKRRKLGQYNNDDVDDSARRRRRAVRFEDETAPTIVDDDIYSDGRQTVCVDGVCSLLKNRRTENNNDDSDDKDDVNNRGGGGGGDEEEIYDR